MSDLNNPLAEAAAELPERRGPGRPPKPKPEPIESPRSADGAVIAAGETVLKAEVTPDLGTKEYDEYVARIRDKRKPFGDFIQKLARKPRPGYYRVWINDEPGRIQQAKNAGYVHVLDEATGRIEVLNINPHIPGAAQLGYLMEIPQEIWELDQIMKHKRADQIEAAIRKSKVIAASSSDASEDAGGFYVPGGGSKVDNIGKGRI